MKNISIQLNELQDFLDFVNERDKQLWERYLIKCTQLNDKLLKTTNLEKKLKKLKKSKLDSKVQILFQEDYEGDLKEAENYLDYIIKKNYVIDENVDDTSSVVLHHYVNRQTGYTHTSIYDNDIRIINEGYEQVD